MNTFAPSLSIAGVPEAFNDCWDKAAFEKHGIGPSPRFASHPGGSGAMLQSILAREVDAAFALTDCIVTAIENGVPVRLAGPLITSPLTWAVIVDAQAATKSLDELSSSRWGISRVGSGSHVMVQTVAKQKGWERAPEFKVCGDFTGLRSALRGGEIDAFLWEHYTTRPYEVRGEVRIVGGIPTPWGCFSVMVHEKCERVEEVQKVVDAFLEAGHAFVQDAGSVETVAEKYGMARSDAQEWMDTVRYASVGERIVEKEQLERARATLREASVITEYRCPGGVESYHVRA